MSFMQRIFGAAPAPAPVATTNNPAQNAPVQTQQTQQTDANGVVPQGGGAPDPLQKFAEIWNAPETDPNAPTGPEPVTPEKMQEAAGKVDFTKVLNPQELAKIAAGGDEAVQVFAQSLNKVAQTVYGHSAYAATKIVEQAVSQAESRFASKLPTLINSQSSKNDLLSENKAFQNPAVAPIVEMIHSQLVQKYPNATAQEIKAMAKEMMQGAASVFNPAAPPSAEDQKKASADDWSAYM